MGRHHWRRQVGAFVAGLVLATPALTACASGGPIAAGAPGPGASTGADPGAAASPPGATTGVTSPGAGGTEGPGEVIDPAPVGVEKTLRGTAVAGVEANCVLLAADDGESYLLIGGDRALITSGARLEVAGQIVADLMTTCQQGVPFTVRTVRAI